jgi:hypothetical protein
MGDKTSGCYAEYVIWLLINLQSINDDASTSETLALYGVRG